jgi:hypothetical protein
MSDIGARGVESDAFGKVGMASPGSWPSWGLRGNGAKVAENYSTNSD